LIWWALYSPSGAAEPIRDVTLTFSTPDHTSRHPTTANFYYNGRAIGGGLDGFKAIVERTRKLAAGTSIVWGPDYSRCGACSGGEPRCVAKYLYPELWQQFEGLVKERRLTLSSDYPGPWPHAVGLDRDREFPSELIVDDPPADTRFNAVLNWEVGENVPKGDKAPDETVVYGRRWHRFSAADKALHGYDLRLFFGQLPENARVLVRVALHEKIDLEDEENSPSELADKIGHVWKKELAGEVRRGRLKVTMTAPPELADALRTQTNNDQRLQIAWSNFQGPGTPHEGILYEVNDQFVGRGDDGFDRILASIDRLPAGTGIVLPRYRYSGRWAVETFSSKKLDEKNTKLRVIVPFADRTDELDAKIAERELKVTFSEISPGTDVPGTVMAWHSGDRFGQAFVSFGRIVRRDELPRPAAATLSWTRYETGERRAKSENRSKRQVESEAFYTLNDVEMGQGVAGFAKAMDKLAALPPRSVVGVRVCLRTKAPFACPLVYEGHRHFERTGFEPYVGMFPWLINVAERRKLEIDWMPDEQQSCGDCELNK
jgi:hypothetical protein